MVERLIGVHRVLALAAMAIGFALVGCSSIKDGLTATQEWYAAQRVEWRKAKENEYKRLAAMPPVEEVESPDHGISQCARQSVDLFNETQKKMKAYVDFVETCREYTGFINDIQYYVEEERLSRDEACRKVVAEVNAADAKLPDDQKLWPRIKRSAAAAEELGPKNELDVILGLNSRVVKLRNWLAKKQSELLKSRKKEKKNRGLIVEIDKRLAECSAVGVQLNDASQCISFMIDQHNRVDALNNDSGWGRLFDL